MINKMMTRIALMFILLAITKNLVNAKDSSSDQQPLTNLDGVLKQANGLKVDSIVDGKLASNVTNTLNEMALNLRKMFVENRRLSSQVQDVLQRMQNVTGINATNTISKIQQQASNVSSLNNVNLNGIVSRFQSP